MLLANAALAAALVTVLPTLLNLIGSAHKRRTMLAGVGSFVLITLICLAVFYFSQPVIAASWTSFYQSWMGWMTGLLIATVITTAAAYDWDDSRYDWNRGQNRSVFPIGCILAVGLFVGVFVIGFFAHITWSGEGAKRLYTTVNVKKMDIGTYPDSDANHIVTVPEETAVKTAQNALNSSNSTLSTIAQPYAGTLQSVQQHAYWIFALQPKGIQENDSVAGVYPGYIAVDAEDPDGVARFVQEDASGKPLQVRFIDAGYGDYHLQRHLWSNGYAGTPLDDFTFEVDDDWRPYWTVTTNRTTLRFEETVPNGLLVVDAQTGAIQPYQLNKLPAWVDRVYSGHTVETMLNWWGDLHKGDYGGPISIGRNSADRYQVGDTPTLVYTKEGYPAWQVELTSQVNDTAVSYVALFSGRSNDVRLYSIREIQIERGIIEAVKKSNLNPQGNEPQHLAIHKVYGRLTWVGTMAPNGNMQGIALVPADAKPTGTNIVIAPTMSQALNMYRTVLASGGNAKPGENVTYSQASGEVERLSNPLTESGKATFYFTLKGDSSHYYKATLDPMAESPQQELPFIQVGTKVTVQFIDGATTLRVVQAYDDLGLELSKKYTK